MTEARDDLNAHAERLHNRLGSAEYTPYDVIGHLVRLRHEGVVKPAYLALEGPEAWGREDFNKRSRLVSELAERVLNLGVPGEHLWRGIDLDRALPTEIARIEARLSDLVDQFSQIQQDQASIAALLEKADDLALGDLEALLELASRISACRRLGSNR